MVIWLGIGFIALVLLWIIACTAMDMLEEYDRKEEAAKRPQLTDRLIKYQEHDY